MADLYKLQGLTVDPIDSLLKALVAVNVHAVASVDAGWSVEFALNDARDQVTVQISRSAEAWPTDIDGERVK